MDSIFKQDVVIPAILFEHYSHIGLDEMELMIVIKLLNHLKTSDEMPSFETLSENTSMDKHEVMQMISRLITKDMLKINVKKQQNEHFVERFDLSPLNEKLLKHIKDANQIKQNETIDFSAVFERFESVFGRPLTPIELETISNWIDTDKHSEALITAALNEAAAHNKISIKYIDRILLNWKKRNVTSVDDSKKVSDEYRAGKTMTKTVPKIPVFDWVNGDNPYDK